MTADVMDAKVLVLNKLWVPINVTRVFRAIQQVWRERALFLDPETCATHDVDSWIMTWEDAIKAAHIEENKVIHAGGIAIRLPEVIVCSEYKGMAHRQAHGRPKFSRFNLLRRDKNMCAYCNRKFAPEDLTMEHVVPRCKGGKTDWTNVVLACVACNSKKKDMSVAEAGMKLRRKPYVPRIEDVQFTAAERLTSRIGRAKAPKTWEQFLGKLYMNVTLEE